MKSRALSLAWLTSPPAAVFRTCRFEAEEAANVFEQYLSIIELSFDAMLVRIFERGRCCCVAHHTFGWIVTQSENFRHRNHVAPSRMHSYATETCSRLIQAT